MTPHNKAQKTDISSIVLLPGCPLRAKWIAEQYLTDIKLVNDVRNMYAYTGTYKNKKITVMGSGMGIASAGIYTYELFSKNMYDVDLIIRVGSCGAYSEDINVGDVIVVGSTYSTSTYAEQMGLEVTDNTLFADKKLVEFVKNVANQQKIDILTCRAHCTDAFYEPQPVKGISKTKTDVAEMETFALFTNAKLHNKNAICLLTCSDSLVLPNKTKLLHSEREKQLDKMIKIALETAYLYENK